MSKYEVKCLFCYWLGDYEGYYCKNQERMKAFEKQGIYAPNADFSVKYDGEDCKYFWDEDKGYKTWKIFNTLKIIGKFILKIEIPDLSGITGGKY